MRNNGIKRNERLRCAKRRCISTSFWFFVVAFVVCVAAPLFKRGERIATPFSSSATSTESASRLADGDSHVATKAEVAVVANGDSRGLLPTLLEEAQPSEGVVAALDAPKSIPTAQFDESLSAEASTVDETPSNVAPSEENAVRQVALCASEPTVELQYARICDLRIGDRLPGANPEGNDGSDESIFANERHFVYTLRVPKSDGTFCTAKLLRPADWLEEQPIQMRCALDGKVCDEIDAVLAEMLPLYSTQRFDLEVWLDLEELGCVGWSKVVDVNESFEYQLGVGNLVTGTFEHTAQELIDLQIEDQDKPIGSVAPRLFWSVIRQAFAPARDQFEGERTFRRIILRRRPTSEPALYRTRAA